MDNNAIKNLKEALAFSPDNVPLRLHLAEMLLHAENYAEAEEQYKLLIELSPKNQQAKCGLAKACYLQNKLSLAYVILEELCHRDDTTAEYHVMFAKVLIKEGMKSEAQEQYKIATDKEPMTTDPELDALFKVPMGDFDDMDDEEQDSFGNKSYLEKPSTTFKDVGGMNKVKEEIQLKIIYPLTHSELYKAYGKKAGGGILLYGPPGCGKTHIARATAGEINAKFINVGINDILDMWIGGSERKLHEIFELARKSKPCVLFFDEVDALGANRSDMKNSAGRHLINQFLSEMDGIEASNDGVLVLAATNAPWHLDPAFRRPGRFDRIIFVQPPDESAREQILKIQLKDKPVKDISISDISSRTKEFSGADLKSLIDVVVEKKLIESFKNGTIEPITTKDITGSIAQVNPSTKEWFTIAKNYALYANESGLYNDILDYLKIKK
ncbi:MAG: family ATPase [Bacteroidetes bacterium]|nr:family ATPase [Bacteroidota bacterium]